MKLIDLLVQELPGRGGWPRGVGDIEMHADGDIYFDASPAPKGFILPCCSDGWHTGFGVAYNNAVREEQYEAALAASKQVEWNGEGLPPAGCECEYNRAGDWVVCKIVFISDFHVILQEKEEICWKTQSCQFRPIRTESERKRDDIVKALQIDERGDGVWITETEAEAIYEAISSGRIPGIRLE